MPLPDVAEPTGKNVAVIGTGPAGLTAAEEMIRRGHAVTVFDAWPAPGGLLVYGIPGFKLDKRIIAEKIEYLGALGVSFVCDTLIGKDLSIDDLLERAGFHAVFIGTGAPVGSKLNAPGENLQGIFQATDFLVRGNLPLDLLPRHMRERPVVGQNVVVIGGGDTAMDCVRTAKRLQMQNHIVDGHVTCVYRRSEKEMPGRGEERVNAREEGIEFEFLTAPLAFIGDADGQVQQMECVRMSLGEPDASGRRKPVPVEGSNFRMDVQTVICALGYNADPLVAQTTPNLRVNKWGLLVTDPCTGETSRAGVYAGGDNVSGADLVVTAVAAAQRAARAMDDYLRRQGG